MIYFVNSELLFGTLFLKKNDRKVAGRGWSKPSLHLFRLETETDETVLSTLKRTHLFNIQLLLSNFQVIQQGRVQFINCLSGKLSMDYGII